MKIQAWINIFFLTAAPFVSGCAQFLEHRSFVDEMEREDSFFVAGRDFRTVPGDSGEIRRNRQDIMARTPASYRSKEEYETQKSLEQELQRRENGLSEHERIVYQQAKSVLSTASERIYYLNLPRHERQDYLQMRMAKAGPYAYAEKERRPLSLLEQRDVSAPALQVGMDKNRVIDMMGRPSQVDVAGDPRFENERWVYQHDGPPSYIYFEDGQVHGWTFP